MFPYFQKISLHAAEQTVTDPVRDFLSRNPSFGTLLFQVTGGQGAFPIAGASVIIWKELADGQILSLTLSTDESGKTPPLSLPAPSRSLSQKPDSREVFASYQAELSARGHLPVKITHLPVFDGITTIQPVSLSPDFGQENDKTVIIDDKGPDL